MGRDRGLRLSVRNAACLKLGGGPWYLLFLVPCHVSEMIFNFLKGQWEAHVSIM